jgi:hypothetical protein
MAVSAPLSAPPLSIYTNVLTRITLLLECVLSLYQLHPCRHIYYIYILTTTGTQTYIYILTTTSRGIIFFLCRTRQQRPGDDMHLISSHIYQQHGDSSSSQTHEHTYTYIYYKHTYIYTHHNFAAAPPPPRLTPHAPAPWRRGGARTPSARPSQR